MKKSVLKLMAVSVLSLISFVSVTSPLPVSAVETNTNLVTKESREGLVSIVDKYVTVEDGRFILNDENLLKEELLEKQNLISEINNASDADFIIETLKIRFSELNDKAETYQITIKDSGRIVNNTPEFRVAGQSSVYEWWGVRHTFHWDDAARDYAYNVRQAAHANAGVAFIGGAVFGGVGAVPNGLTAVYAYSIADTVDYNANKSGNGVVLDINWWLTYSCYPR